MTDSALKFIAGVCSAAFMLTGCGDDSGMTTASSTGTATVGTVDPTTSGSETTDNTTTMGPVTVTEGTMTGGSTTDTTTAGTTAGMTTDPTMGTTNGTDPTMGGMSSSSGSMMSESESESETNGMDECLATEDKLIPCDANSDDPFHAIGVNCPDNGEYTFIDSSEEDFYSLNNQDNARPWRVARGFGSAEDPNNPGELLFRPREGEKFLMLSTGRISQPNGQGIVIESLDSQKSNHNNFNDDSDTLPSPMSPEYGSNNGMGGMPGIDCDGINDCSDSLKENWDLGDGDPNDKIWLNFDVTVPAGVYGFQFDFVFFSAEWDLFVGDPFNDMFIVWSTSEVYTGNITFINGKPLTVTSLDQEILNNGYYGDTMPIVYEPLLEGTGFETRASTGWYGAQASVTPGEDITVSMALMDMGDSNLATLVLIDNWRWSCEGCMPNEIDDCEVEQIIE